MAKKKKQGYQNQYLLQQGDNKFTYNDSPVEQGAYFAGYASEELRPPGKFELNSYSGTFPIYAFLFNQYSTGEVTNFDTVPFDLVAGKVNDYVRSMTGDFYEDTENMAWLEVGEMFFHYLFLNDYIYVEYISEEDKYNIYYKNTGLKMDKDEDLKGLGNDNWFVNILTGDSVWFTDPDDLLVRCSWNGIPDTRFYKWFRLAYDIETKTRIIDKQLFYWNKRITLDLTNNRHISQTDIDLLEKELVNLSITFHNKTDSGFVNFLPNNITATEIKEAQAIMYQKFDREAGNMGLVPNLNAKQERLIVAEAHTSMDKQIDELRRRFNQLKLMCKRMNDKGWPTLNFTANTAENLGLVVNPVPAGGPGATGEQGGDVGNTETKEEK